MSAGNPPSMKVLVDHFVVAVGADGSLLVPKAWRPFFGKGRPVRVVLARRPGALIGLHAWHGVRKLRAVVQCDMPDEETRQFQQELGMPVEVALSSRFRLRLPDELRRWAGIRTEAVLLGCVDHTEITSMKTWKRIGVPAPESVVHAARELGL